jgi:hypothetical protein
MEEAQKEDLQIKFALQNGENIACIVNQKHFIDNINPTAYAAFIKAMNIVK